MKKYSQRRSKYIATNREVLFTSHFVANDIGLFLFFVEGGGQRERREIFFSHNSINEMKPNIFAFGLTKIFTFFTILPTNLK